MRILSTLFILFFIIPGFAQDSAEQPVVPLDVEVPPPPPPPEDDRVPLDQVQPEPPPLPEKLNPAESLVPEVRIIRKEREIVQEFRIDGRLSMVQITPLDGGPSYYIIDTNGDGVVDTRTTDIETGVKPVLWRIYSWD